MACFNSEGTFTNEVLFIGLHRNDIAGNSHYDGRTHRGLSPVHPKNAWLYLEVSVYLYLSMKLLHLSIFFSLLGNILRTIHVDYQTEHTWRSYGLTFPSGNPASLSVDCCTLMSHVGPLPKPWLTTVLSIWIGRCRLDCWSIQVG